ncbi:molybdenum cofactor guanylyltransferase [Streptomyces sp. Je 1-4]|uniref:molybdenum cofactor guanylyltransferase n=1 Tax=Streptomyces TaxID=1883 RepID=UPI0021D85873|nr:MULTISPECIES: molybdenum cofactor guanylyltransferase [unclassified Streptomyces]UYB41360.1 molybdenum cofactor guanylyltransferase [Streptomyces sp. Je 1-4]UZQ37547.1 molybdenum cofactor guanylyltransferase [Streptomyces sp. Je 1-4] [Streptomyces sp. Je 1-4 4N24]UZQ44964.1 molybdenum cofactor guanylyltransferase [Streptomyces sp. Je 1-4] [Streptomyces sp. Je 1-4 4N24_ara]
MNDLTDHDAIVLAGGAARRLGGADKPALSVGGRPLLDRVLAACPDAVTTVVVGPARPTARDLVHALEDPPGGGPLAALDAGLRHTTAPTVLVLSADLPFLTAATVRSLLEATRTAGAAGPGESSPRDGAMLRDASGRDQPLVAAYRAEPLRRELARLRAAHGSLAGLPLRALLAELVVERVPDALSAASFDCDTWEDISAARARIREHGNVLDEWITAVKAELGIELDVDTAALLDLARDAAHGVTRPAAPLTTFLIGYAAGRQDRDVKELADRAAALAHRWAAEGASEAGSAQGEAKPAE